MPHVPGTVYDPGAEFGGGCTVIGTDKWGNPQGEFVGISGTAVNCAGGPTPWGTWLTCEETELKSGSSWSGQGHSGTYQKDHGYVFEVFEERRRADPRADQGVRPLRPRGAGRRAEPQPGLPVRGRQWSDRPVLPLDGTGRREARPRHRRQLGANDGVLEAMQIRLDDGSIIPDVAYVTSAQLGRPFKVPWNPVPERDGQTMSVRKQFTDGPVTRGKKFEGVWSTDDGCYIVNSFAFGSSDLPGDATKHDGMVWFYDYARDDHAGHLLPAQPAGGVDPQRDHPRRCTPTSSSTAPTTSP